LNVTGPGTLVLSGTNTYSGGTNLSNGTLIASDNANPLGGGAVALNPITGNTAILYLTGSAPSIGSLASSGAGISQVILGNSVTPSGTALTVGALGTTTTFSGVISDAGGGATGSLIKTGAGEIFLSGANTYSGGTTINGGVIAVNSDSSLGAVGGTLLINAGNFNSATPPARFRWMPLSCLRSIALLSMDRRPAR
jgi:autotransporter-associated beta strand protein